MTERFHFTFKDHGALEDMRRRLRPDETALAALLERKLANAVLSQMEHVREDAVTLNSRVRFRVDGGEPQTRIVTRGAGGHLGAVLPLANRRGLALLGLVQGQSIAYEGMGGATETIDLIAVLHQPERARRTMEEQERDRRVLRLVHSAEPRIRPAPTAAPWGGDDPGPSAA